MTTTHDVVAALGPAIAQRIGASRYQMWFADNTRFAIHDNDVQVGVPNRFFQEWLHKNFFAAVQEAAHASLGRPVGVKFTIDPALFRERRDQQREAAPVSGPALRPAPARTLSRRWLRLEDFVVGPSNRLAHASAVSFVERPESTPSPLTLYGPCGVGKTHLLEGMRYALYDRSPTDPIQYVTSEEFTNRFLLALKTGKLPAFRNQFRECRALFLDNVHFLANKEATQEEFLHTFEALQRRGRPVAVTCDCHPKLIPQLMPELADRLLGGVTWSIDPPCLETKADILKAKASRLGCDVPEDVIDFLAGELRSNVRELEGALHSVHHFSLTHNQSITLAVAREAAGELIRHNSRIIQMKEVERAVCQVLNLEGRILHSKGRAREISHPRMLAVYLARKHTHLAYSEIGRFFGGRNHSTAMAAEKKVREWLEADATIALGNQRWRTRELLDRVERELLR